MSLPDNVTGPLEEWVVQQRWFASKSREIAALNMLQRVELSERPGARDRARRGALSGRHARALPAAAR